jgi:hypothetical protein
MSRTVAHWGPREWRGNTGDLVQDPERPKAFPSTYPMDLLGRIRVKLAAEGQNLVGYGFRGQRVELPSKPVGAVHAVRRFSSGGFAHGPSLLMLDHHNRILLRGRPVGLRRRPGRVTGAGPTAQAANARRSAGTADRRSAGRTR